MTDCCSFDVELSDDENFDVNVAQENFDVNVAQENFDVELSQENFDVELSQENFDIELVEADVGAGSPELSVMRDRVEIEEAYKVAYTTDYKELTYDAGNLTNVDIWDTAAKTTKLFSKVITYDAGNISQTVITDEITGKVLTASIAYAGGDISSVTRVLA